MKYVSNTTKNPINYKDKTIPPGASVMLNNKGEVVDEITDNTQTIAEEIEKLRGQISNTVTLAQVDERLEEIECRTKTLVTSCTSKTVVDLGCFGPVYDEAKLHKTDGKPVEFFCIVCCYPLNTIEPGLYLGNIGATTCINTTFPLGDQWSYCNNGTKKCMGSCANQPGCLQTIIEPHICSKNVYCFSSAGAIYEIDEETSRGSYVVIQTRLYCKSCCLDSNGMCRWLNQKNKTYNCVKACFEDFANCKIDLSGTLTRLQ